MYLDIRVFNVFCLISVLTWSLSDGSEHVCDHLEDSGRFDFIIVGGGAGGSVIARRLAEVKKWNILLLEAGGDAPLQYLIPSAATIPGPETLEAHEWGFGSQPSELNCLSFINGQCNFRRAKSLGGCTTNNYLMYVRGNHQDYKEWADLGNTGWSYEEVLPYFKKSELFLAYPITPKPTNTTVGAKYHGQLGTVTVNHYDRDPASILIRYGFIEAAIEIGVPNNIDYCGESQIGFSDIYSTIDIDGFRKSAARAFLTYPPDNLFICKHKLVDKVIFHKKKAVGAEIVLQNKDRIKIYAKKEIILSAGAFGTPGILERSGVGDKKLLKKLGIPLVHHLPGVGENLQDHPFLTGLVFQVNFRSSAPTNIKTMTLTSFGGFINSNGSSSVPDIQYIFDAFPTGDGLITKLIPALRFKYSSMADLISRNHFHDLVLTGPAVLRPNSRGSVHIFEKDPEATPSIIPNYFDNQEDIQTMIRGIKFMENVMRTNSMKYFDPQEVPMTPCKQHKFRSDRYFECIIRHYATSLYHPSCTCHMGPKNDPWAVVDDRLKVYGLKKLRIGDASIFPLIPRGNLQAPTYMVGEKLADIIKEEYHQPIDTFDVHEF